MLPSGTQPVISAKAIGATDMSAVCVPHDGIFAPLGSVGEKTVGGAVSECPRCESPPPQAIARIKTSVAVSVTTVVRIVGGLTVRRMSL